MNTRPLSLRLKQVVPVCCRAIAFQVDCRTPPRTSQNEWLQAVDLPNAASRILSASVAGRGSWNIRKLSRSNRVSTSMSAAVKLAAEKSASLVPRLSGQDFAVSDQVGNDYTMSPEIFCFGVVEEVLVLEVTQVTAKFEPPCSLVPKPRSARFSEHRRKWPSQPRQGGNRNSPQFARIVRIERLGD